MDTQAITSFNDVCNSHSSDGIATDASLMEYVSVFTRFHQQAAATSSESDYGTEEHFASPLTSGSLSAEDIASLQSLQHHGARALREQLGRLQQAAEAEAVRSFGPDDGCCDSPSSRTLFFAKVPPSASAAEVQALFSQHGAVEEINLFKAWAGARSSKGCGLVVFATKQGAVSAIEHLHAVHHWEGGDSPMVVEWMDEGKQRDKKSAREQAQANQDAAVRRQQGSANSSPRRTAKDRSSAAKAVIAAPLVPETAPVGCASDAYKLFVGNVPRCCTEEHLLPLFESLGTVVELVVVRDKLTLASKGSAFVWFATGAMADNAVAHLEAHPCRLVDPSGHQERPLVVRRAKPTRTPATGRHCSNNVLAGVPPMQQQGRLNLAPGLPWFSGNLGSSEPLPDATDALMRMAGAMSMEIPMHVQPALTAQIHQRMSVQAPVSTSTATSSFLPLDFSSPVGLQTNSNTASSSNHHLPMPHSLSRLQPQHQAAADPLAPWLGNAGAPGASASSKPHMATMPLAPFQLSTIGGHVHTVATISGAKLTVGVLPDGLLQLCMEGQAGQVQAAQAMLSIVLGSNASAWPMA